MKLRGSRMRLSIHIIRNLVAILCAVLLIPGDAVLCAWPQQADTSAEAAKIPNDQLDSLVAPIALYPDPLLSQTLVASTYPLEIIQLQQWLEKNKNLKDKALTEAVQKQDWDPSIQAMAQFPDVVKQLAENIKWTTDLGNAFLAQQSDVMDAVQRMRKKAQDKGNLKTTEQQKVETKVVENKQVIVVQQASPEVVYVPSYNPTVVYGAPVYAYPPIAYPPPGYYAAGMALSFGVGVAMGAAWGGGGWGWGCGWGGNNDITVNRNNTFVNNSNRQNLQGGNRANARGGNTWQHNPQHRGGAPYSNRATANRYGGTARGDTMSTRQASARQNQAQRGSSMNRGAGATQPTAMNRSAGGGGVGDRSAGGGSNFSGGDRVGNRSTSGAGSRDMSAFGGGGGGGSGSSARASSARGASSMGGGSRSFGGGGGRMGGGGGRRR
jgi:hypothetical protein